MILAISTSSPIVLVSIFEDSEVVASYSQEANRNASYLVAQWISDAKIDFSNVESLVVDVGPGGFTGVKVGVTMAKMLAYSSGCKLYGISAFDLISSTRSVAIPYKKGHFCAREVGCEPVLMEAPLPPDFVGYGLEGVEDRYPSLEFSEIHNFMIESTPECLVPLYIANPSISKPKVPYPSL